MLKGFSLPLSPKGKANLVPSPPWHYVGNVIAIEYEADRASIEAYLPGPLTYASDRCCVYFIDWQYASEMGEEYLNPLESQYKETILLMSAQYNGEEIAYCPYIWVDQDKSLMRGIFQGWPKQLGETQMTKRFGLQSKAAPKDICAGTLSVYGKRMIEGQVRLQEACESTPRPAFAGAALLRYFPNLQKGYHDQPLINELVQLKSRNIQIGQVQKGNAALKFTEKLEHEVSDFKPVKVGSGYQFEVSLIVDDIMPLESL